ncbi:hypothetical protein VTJ49DRAFT_5555 [Mycothermus thermophilus]|uniref:Galactose oxidase n=1 Tax=Humicola insolens TaxID=85995 RepID=A0ABR3V320_HUMIN
MLASHRRTAKTPLPARAGLRGRRPPELSGTARPRRLAASPNNLTTMIMATAALSLAGRASAFDGSPLPYIPTTILLPPADDSGSGMAYIFTPSDNGNDPRAVELLALNVSPSSTLRAAALQPTKLFSSPPPFFADDKDNNCPTFAPSILRNGTLAVITGSCSPGNDDSSSSSSSSVSAAFWTYTPPSNPNNEKTKLSQWTRHPLAPSSSTSDHVPSGPYYLGGVLAFSAQLSPSLSPPTIYLYGGMCPAISGSGSGVTYSNHMLRISPAGSTDFYTLDHAPTGGQQQQGPLARAGFSWTELPPSVANRTAEVNIVTQQTSHVLLGGHAQGKGFEGSGGLYGTVIPSGMDTAMVWSLPEETWRLVKIAMPGSSSFDSSDKPDLARLRQSATRSSLKSPDNDNDNDDAGPGFGAREIRDSRSTATTFIDGRSGHTAVLSEDGTKLVVYGGWTTSTSTDWRPARPQLVVARVGVGLDDWVWEMPSSSGADDGDGEVGVYGHGAAVLPGNVMMVYGGYEIGASGTGSTWRRKRAVGGRNMFYNITSGTWSDEYVAPVLATGGTGSSGSDGEPRPNETGDSSGNSIPDGSESNGNDTTGTSDASSSSSRARQIGLGVGLGLGLTMLLLVAAFFLGRAYRRRRRRRNRHEEVMHGLAEGVNGSLPRGIGGSDDGEMSEREHGLLSHIFPWTAASARDWYGAGDDPYSVGRRSLAYEHLHHSGGAGVYMPPPPLSASASSGSRPKGAKGLFIPASSGYDFAPLYREQPGRISPIYEAEEEDEEADLGPRYPLKPNNEELEEDPFMTPTTGSPTRSRFSQLSQLSSPGPNSQGHGAGGAAASGAGEGQGQDRDVQAWVSDVDALTRATQPHGASHTPSPPPGRNTPLRRPPSVRSAHQNTSGAADPALADDGRTVSNLSERSAWSFVRGGSILAVGRGGNDDNKNNNDRLDTTVDTTTSFGSTSYHAAARSSFLALQAEGPSLLLGSPAITTDGYGAAAAAANNNSSGGGVYYSAGVYSSSHAYGGDGDGDHDGPEPDYYVTSSHSIQYVKPPQRRSWLGSLKRVFSSSGGGGCVTTTTATATGATTNAPDSPTREGLLSRYSQHGRTDSGASNGGGGGGGGGGLSEYDTVLNAALAAQGRERWGGVGGNGDDDDGSEEGLEQDLERAAERRTVQIMFTVPREPLRVVNAEVEREESVHLVLDPEEEEEKKQAPEMVGEDEEKEEEEQSPEITTNNTTISTPTRSTTSTDMTVPSRPNTGVSIASNFSIPSAPTSPPPTLHTATAVRLERASPPRPSHPRPSSRVLAMVESFETRNREGSSSPSSRRSSPERR